MRTLSPITVVIAVTFAALMLAGCSTPPSPPTESYPPDPTARTLWTLRHRVVDAQGLEITGQRIGHFAESTSVAVGAEHGAPADDCFVTVFAPGQGGPGNMVGEKIRTTFDGHPAVRNGTGAEGTT